MVTYPAMILNCTNRFDALSNVTCEDVNFSTFNDTNICDDNSDKGTKQCGNIGGIQQFYVKNQCNLKIAHINVNSIRHKFHPLSEMLTKSYIDVLFVQETKLNNSFPCGQFSINQFITYRQDVTCNCGGIMAIVRADIPQRRRLDLESGNNASTGRIEMMVLELTIKREKWLLCSLYKQPKVSDSNFKDILENVITKLGQDGRNFLIIGDFNVNTLKQNCLKQLFDLNGVKNVVNVPTCFKSDQPTCIDLAVTNVHKRLQNVVALDVGLSDFHHMICLATKCYVPQRKKQCITYRSYKHFDQSKYLDDLSVAPFHVCEIFDNLDDAYWYSTTLLHGIIDEHAPVKYRIVKCNQIPYMNSSLRKAMNVRDALRRKYHKFKTTENWSRYRTQRNHVTTLRRQSLMKYMKSKCTSLKPDANSVDFWRVIKPLISDNVKISNDITLMESDTVENNQDKVSAILNNYFVHIADGIGQPDCITSYETLEDIIDEHYDHASVKRIRNEMSRRDHTFQFQEVDIDYVYKKLSNLNPKKATGHDQIPPKLIKIGARSICQNMKYLLNMSIQTSCFPDDLKAAEVTPIFKKDNRLSKTNYRPISVLPCLSKLFEGMYVDQLSEFFETLFVPEVSGFRKGHNCQHVLLNFVEQCKHVLDDGKLYGALMTDLSKAFDCLPPKLLISKLYAYGVNRSSCMLIANYFLNRQQRVKLSGARSDWMGIHKGSPQGSLMGPLTYNIHSNDLIFVINQLCHVFNYADDNTVGCYGNSFLEVKLKLENVATVMIDWFTDNHMKVNPSKFQCIIFGKQATDCEDHVVRINDTDIIPQTTVKLLGVTVDQQLNFSHHIHELCSKAGRKMNVIARLSSILDREAKLLLYNSFVLSNLSYCPVIWHFCKRSDMVKLEKIQYRTLKYIDRDFLASYSDLRERYGRSLLYENRQRTVLYEVFRCIHKENPAYLHRLIEHVSHNINLRNNNVKLPNVNTVKYGHNSFRYKGASLWNKIGVDFKRNNDAKVFKGLLNCWKGIICNCSYCDICTLLNI